MVARADSIDSFSANVRHSQAFVPENYTSIRADIDQLIGSKEALIEANKVLTGEHTGGAIAEAGDVGKELSK